MQSLRKRPLPQSAVAGRSASSSSSKKPKHTPRAEPPSLAVNVHYEKIARASLAHSTIPPPRAIASPSAEQLRVPSPSAGIAPPRGALEAALRLAEQHADESDESHALQPLTASAQAPSAGATFSRSPSPTAGARGRLAVSSSFSPLSRLRFLLASACKLALTSPSTSQRLMRTMRNLAHESSVELQPELRSSFCAHCTALLLPGVNCTRRTALDAQRTAHWRRKHEKRIEKGKRKRSNSSTAEQPPASSTRDEELRAADVTVASEANSVKRTARKTSAERRRAMNLRRTAQRASAVQRLRFFHTVISCAQCGQETEVEGSVVKRGGHHCPGTRTRTGDDIDAVKKRKRPQAKPTSRTATEESGARPGTGAAATKAEEKKARQRRLRLQEQQQRAPCQSAAKQRTAGEPTVSDAFSGSLFFRFQKPVRAALHIRVRRIRRALSVLVARTHCRRRCAAVRASKECRTHRSPLRPTRPD